MAASSGGTGNSRSLGVCVCMCAIRVRFVSSVAELEEACGIRRGGLGGGIVVRAG